MENDIFTMNHDELLKFKHELEKLDKEFIQDPVRQQCVLTDKYPSEEVRQQYHEKYVAYNNRSKIIDIIKFILKIINEDIYRGADPEKLNIKKIVENCVSYPLN